MVKRMSSYVDFHKSPVLTPAYWKRPANENQGDENPHKVYEAVGFALTSWELMEEAFAELYLVLVKAPKASDNPTRRAFGSIESNSGRRKAVEAAAEAFFRNLWDDKSIRSAFLNLTNGIAQGSKRRDDIAHGIVLGQVIDGVSYGSFLFPPDYNTLRTNMYIRPGDVLGHTGAVFRFTGSQVREFGFKFQQLQEDVRRYKGLLACGADVFVRAVNGVNVFGGKLPKE